MSKNRGAQRRGISAPADAGTSDPPQDPEAPNDVSSKGDGGPLRNPDAPPPPVNGAGEDGIGGAPPSRSTHRRPRYDLEVAPGRSLVGARGNLDAGAEVHLRDFVTGKGGEDAARATLDRLIRKGLVIDNRKGQPAKG